jgi:hypothetical protein
VVRNRRPMVGTFRDQWSRLYKLHVDRNGRDFVGRKLIELGMRRSRVTGLNGWDRLRS